MKTLTASSQKRNRVSNRDTSLYYRLTLKTHLVGFKRVTAAGDVSLMAAGDNSGGSKLKYDDSQRLGGVPVNLRTAKW